MPQKGLRIFPEPLRILPPTGVRQPSDSPSTASRLNLPATLVEPSLRGSTVATGVVPPSLLFFAAVGGIANDLPAPVNGTSAPVLRAGERPMSLGENGLGVWNRFPDKPKHRSQRQHAVGTRSPPPSAVAHFGVTAEGATAGLLAVRPIAVSFQIVSSTPVGVG